MGGSLNLEMKNRVDHYDLCLGPRPAWVRWMKLDEAVIMRYIALVVFSFLPWGSSLGQSRPEAVEPCYLLTHLQDYNDRIISIRGEYFVGGHGLYLRINDCPTPLTTKGYRWPPVLLLSISDSETRKFGRSFESLQAALLDLGAKIAQKIGSAGKEDWSPFKITFTGVGLLHTHAQLELHVVQQGGTFLTDGFGAGGWAPAEMFLQSISDIEIETRDRPAPPRDH